MASGGFPDPGRHGDGGRGDTPIDFTTTTSSDDSDNQTTSSPHQSTDTSTDLETSAVQASPLSQMFKPVSSGWKLKVFLMKLAKDIDDEELEQMKFLMKGELGMGKRALSKIENVTQFFDHMMEADFVNEDNLLQLQNLLWQLGRKDLHAKFVHFAKECRTSPLHFFTPDPNPRNGYLYADFHIGGGKLETTSRQELEILRAEISELICVPPRFVFIKGLEPLNSLIVTLMVPEMAAFALLELSQVEKSILQSMRVDRFGVGAERVMLADLKFEKPALLSEKDEILRILKKKDLLASELDKSQARLIERGKALSSSEEELAKVKVTSDQLKTANDHAMMILATLVYQDLAHNARPTDSLSRLSILTYFRFCLKQFQTQFPEAAKHVGNLLDANALVVRKTERDSHKNYVERLQIHQLALEHRIQTVPPVYPLSERLFQRPSEAVRQQYLSSGNQLSSHPLTSTPGHKQKTTLTRKKLFDRRAEKLERQVSSSHPYSSVLKEISLKLRDSQKEKLLGNMRFNKVEQEQLDKHPERFLHILFDKEMGGLPEDPCDHVLRKLRIIEDKDLDASANKLLSKRKSDLAKKSDSSSGCKGPLKDFGKSVYKPDLQLRHATPKMEQRGDKSDISDSKKMFSTSMYMKDTRSSETHTHGVHKSVSESALHQHDLSGDMHEKLDKLLSEIESVKMMIHKTQTYQSPVGVGPKWSPSITEL